MPAPWHRYIVSHARLRACAGARKGIVFRKRLGVGKVASSCDTCILCSESTLHGWEELLNTVRHVYLPLVSASCLATGAGQEGKKFLDTYQRMLASVEATDGYVRGQTLLPLPPDAILSCIGGGTRSARGTGMQRKASQKQLQGSRDRMHVLETSVVTWTRLIKAVLKTDTADVVDKLEQPGPLAEVAAQATHADNLASVLEQLQGSSIRNILAELGLLGSTYATAFAAVEKEVAAAAERAESNKRFANTLRPFFARLSDPRAGTDDIIASFGPMLATLLLVWQHSPHYHRPRRFTSVLGLVCDEAVAQATSRVTTPGISADPLRLQEELREALRLCAALRGTYLDFKAKADVINDKVGSWAACLCGFA